MLTVNSRDGSKLEIALTDPLTVVTLKRVPLSSIKDGAYLGVASREGPKGTRVALEVLVFPEAMRGAGAGHYPWDLQPGSMMTNAPVTGVASQKSGRDLTLTYQGGSVIIQRAAEDPGGDLRARYRQRPQARPQSVPRGAQGCRWAFLGRPQSPSERTASTRRCNGRPGQCRPGRRRHGGRGTRNNVNRQKG